VVYDRERREAARRRLNDVQSRARERYAELTGGRTRAEADLEERVRQAIADGGSAPQELDVVVEGRTVYLRGGVPDPAAVDAAAERIHGVPGVVAVVNLTTSARQEAPQHS
jgi:osmotically-inducible protein OsmY